MQRQRLAQFLFLSLSGLAVASAARAQDMPDWRISGFGTLGVVHTGEREADYTSSVFKANGAGATRRWSTDVDSRLGVQLDATLARHWSAVLQVVSEQGLDNTYRPRVEWANIKYQATPELALRVGRIALPVFLTADYRKVGYAYPWVRPPVEGYNVLPVTSSDGIDATLRWSVGRVRNASQVFYGHNSVSLIEPLHVYGRRSIGISNTSDWGALSVRANVASAEISSDIGAELFRAFDAFGPIGQDLTRRYALDHKRMMLANIGVNYDPGAWFVMAEAGRTVSPSFLGSTRSAYVSAGWRWRAFTPYATYARVRATNATTDSGLPVAALPPALAPTAAALNAGLNTLLWTIPQQTSQAAGVRWDLRTNMALKLQYDRVTPQEGSRGTFINPTMRFVPGHPVHVASVALDFVY
ncbi:porin [Massilia sp. GER05]|uniref:porin n=1 Tax=unclassified Massilia TaxID=2609279 RepID=UPI0039AFD4C6